jgi:hypothetical protein
MAAWRYNKDVASLHIPDTGCKKRQGGKKKETKIINSLSDGDATCRTCFKSREPHLCARHGGTFCRTLFNCRIAFSLSPAIGMVPSCRLVGAAS